METNSIESIYNTIINKDKAPNNLGSFCQSLVYVSHTSSLQANKEKRMEHGNFFFLPHIPVLYIKMNHKYVV